MLFFSRTPKRQRRRARKKHGGSAAPAVNLGGTVNLHNGARNNFSGGFFYPGQGQNYMPNNFAYPAYPFPQADDFVHPCPPNEFQMPGQGKPWSGGSLAFHQSNQQQSAVISLLADGRANMGESNNAHDPSGGSHLNKRKHQIQFSLPQNAPSGNEQR